MQRCSLLLAVSALAASSAFGSCDFCADESLGLAQLRLEANVISDDDGFGNIDGRGTIEERGNILGLSAADEEMIRTFTGYVICDGVGNATTASAVVLESSRQIVTTLHTFIDDQGYSREPCKFRNQQSPPQIIPIDLSSPRFGTERPDGARELDDWAVVDLEHPIVGAQPFRLFHGYVRQGEWVIAVAASQHSATREFPRFEPIVQRCRLRDLYSDPPAPLAYITDCDLSPLGSGGPMLVRAPNGRLLVAGILAATGKPHLDGQPYDPATGSLTRVVAAQAEFKVQILDNASDQAGGSD